MSTYIQRMILILPLITMPLITMQSCALMQGRSSEWKNEDSEGRRYRKISRAIETRDLVVGMSIEDVKNSWGEPQRVDNSFDRDNDAERWVYVDGLTSQGFNSLAPKRIIYFEKGMVVGWERLR